MFIAIVVILIRSIIDKITEKYRYGQYQNRVGAGRRQFPTRHKKIPLPLWASGL
jgi:hypothetical protein